MPDFANHIAGTRALNMAAVADFNGDGGADLALPSLDRRRLRLVTFVPVPREIMSLPLAAKAVTNFGIVRRQRRAHGRLRTRRRRARGADALDAHP